MTEKSDARKLRDQKGKPQVKMQNFTPRPTGILGKMIESVRPPEADVVKDACWDELHEMYANCASLFGKYRDFGRYLKDSEVKHFIVEPQLFEEKYAIMVGDLQKLHTELLGIYNAHKSKTGGVYTIEDANKRSDAQMETLNISQHYAMWLERHDGIVTPLFNELSSMVTVAEQNMLAKQQADVQDKTVVTDVEYKETTTTE